MNNETYMDFEATNTNRFEGKHHVIASVALGSLFEDETDIREAFHESISE